MTISSTHADNTRMDEFSFRILVSVHVGIVILAVVYLAFGAIDAGISTPWIFFVSLCISALAAVPFVPQIGLLAFVVLEYGPSRYHSEFFSFVTGLPVLETFGGLLLVGCALWIYGNRRFPIPRVMLTGLVLAFFGWVAIAEIVVLLRGEPWHAIPGRHNPVLYAIGLLLFVIAAATLRSKQNASLFALVLGVVLNIRALLADTVYLDEDIATLIVISIPIALLGLMNGSNTILRIIFGVMLANMLGVLVMTNNRTAALAFLAMLLTLIWQGRHRILVTSIAIPILIGATVFILPTDYTKRFIAIWDSDAEHATAELDRSTVQSRLNQWKAAIQIAQHNPVFGVGLGNYADARQEYSDSPWRSRQGAHNSYLSIAAESGVPGLILFVSAFGAGLVLCNRTIRREGYRWLNPNSGMIRSSLVAYLVTSLFLTRPDMAFAYLLLGWALAAATADHFSGSHPNAPARPRPSAKPVSIHRTIYDHYVSE